MIYFNKQEALRYLGAAPGDKEAGVAVDLAFLKLRNELQPRYTAACFPCRVETGLIEVDTGAGAAATVKFLSRNLARHLQGCRELFIFGATLGIKVDIALRGLLLNSTLAGAAAQAAAAALIETYCDDCCAQLEAQLPGGQILVSRFSPGYGDWPLTEQKKLFPLLAGAGKIGLTLTDGCMMAPVKSVTAIIGIRTGKEPTYINMPALTKNKCASCENLTCAFRR